MHQYRAFNLNIASEIPLPELNTTKFDQADITMAQSAISKPTFEIPGVGKFQVPDSSHIFFDSPMGQRGVRLFLLGSCLGIILQRRGHLVLHGNAIVKQNNCIIFIGPSGSGKSTLAGFFLKAGYQILSDDLCVITSDLQVLPGYSQIKLWRDSAELLGYDCSKLEPLHLRHDKFAVPIGNQFCKQPKKLLKIYTLEPKSHPIAALIQNTYRLQFIETREERARHLEQCQSILKNIPISSLLHRPLLEDENSWKPLVSN